MPPPAGQHSILVIEDNLDLRDGLKTLLEMFGHDVIVADEGSSGVELVRIHRPSLVLCDIGLPGMNGYEVAHAIRNDPALRKVHLVALSGYARPEDRQLSIEAGFNEHISKPPSVERLEAVARGDAGARRLGGARAGRARARSCYVSFRWSRRPWSSRFIGWHPRGARPPMPLCGGSPSRSSRSSGRSGCSPRAPGPIEPGCLPSGAMAASAVAAIVWLVRDRRRLADPATAVARHASPLDRHTADRAVRALTLLGPDGDVRDGDASRDLALLHVERVLASLPVDRIAARGSRVALYGGGGAQAVGIGAGSLVGANGWSVLEGADVLAAHKNVAPVSMKWLEDVDVLARPPDYVRQDPLHEADPGPLLLPYGSVLTLHGAPVRTGRALRLSDGKAEVPFVDDGSGGLVARWNLTDSCHLRVVARFGEVAIPEAQALTVTSIADHAPSVTLDGAPREVKLADETDDIALRYDAADDHGLREVDLVLRAGLTEDRRVLARLDGDPHTEGGHTLRLRDEFLRKSHVPIEVTVEAKDNDPLTGPKWGVSAAITVLPPAVGEPEARRLAALKGLRDAVVDSLAFRLETALPADGPGRKAFAAADVARADRDEELLWKATGSTHSGVRVPARSRMLLVARAQRLRDAVAGQARAPRRRRGTP